MTLIVASFTDVSLLLSPPAPSNFLSLLLNLPNILPISPAHPTPSSASELPISVKISAVSPGTLSWDIIFKFILNLVTEASLVPLVIT